MNPMTSFQASTYLLIQSHMEPGRMVRGGDAGWCTAAAAWSDPPSISYCLQRGGDECGQLFWQIITLSGADDVKQLL